MKELTKKKPPGHLPDDLHRQDHRREPRGVENRDPTIIRPLRTPYSQSGGIAVLKGNLAPDGCVVKHRNVINNYNRVSRPI